MYLFTKHRLIIIVLLCTLVFNCSAYAQNIFKGIYLVSTYSKVPVQDAYVQDVRSDFYVSSDENGFVNLQKIPQGINQLVVSSIGYTSASINLSTLSGAEYPVIFLEPKVMSLAEVTVSSAADNSVYKPISNLDIHLRPIVNSQEVLRMVPGLFIGQHAGGGKAEQIFLRGFDLDHGTDINITIDGMPVNMVSHAHGQGYADLHFVIPELIGKVNFDKGPYFADKGNFTTAGYVAFKTKDFLEHNFIKVEGGQFSSFRNVFGLNLLPQKGDRRTHSLYIAGETSLTKGYFDSPQNFSRFNGLLKYHGVVGKISSLTATLSAFTSKWNASGQIPDRAIERGLTGFYGAIDDTEGGYTSRYNANLELHSYLKNGVTLRNQVFYSRYAFNLFSNFTFFKEDPVNGDQIQQRENRNILGYNGSISNDYMLGTIKVQNLAGVQVRYDDVNDIQLSRTLNRTVTKQRIMYGDVNEMNAAAFVSQRFYLTPKFDITVGLRADFFTNRYDDKLTNEMLSSTSSIISPKLNIKYQASEKVQLYMHNGRGFHSNDTRVAVQQNGREVLPAAYGTEVGNIVKLGKRGVVQTALWYLWLQQEFIYVGDEGVVEPGGKTRRIGFDASFRYEVVKNLFADVDVSLANPRATEVSKTESYLPLAPRYTSAGGLTYKKQSGINGSLRYRYMGDRPANEDNSVVAAGYFVTDAIINYTRPGWEVGLTIQNLFNVRWKETQFDTDSRLKNEPAPVSEIHFTPGTPFFARISLAVNF